MIKEMETRSVRESPKNNMELLGKKGVKNKLR